MPVNDVLKEEPELYIPVFKYESTLEKCWICLVFQVALVT